MTPATPVGPMRILFLTPVPPVSIKPRPHHFVRGLAARGHEVVVVTQVPSRSSAERLGDDPAWRALESCAEVELVVAPKAWAYARCLRALPTPTPLRVAYCASPAYRRRVAELAAAGSFDVVHVDRERLAPALGGLGDLGGSRGLPVPEVVDVTDSISLFLRRMVRGGPLRSRPLAAVELLKMPSFERRVARGCARCLVSSVEDQQALVADGCRALLEVLPNGVDERLFACAGVREPDTVLFVGSMAYAPNVDAVSWFARSILPLVRRARPAARLRVVGHRADVVLRRLGRTDGVDLVGPVPSVGPHLVAASVFVAPMRIGGGFSNKVAEALAAGTPTVATPAAFAGIAGVVPGEHLLPGTGAEELAAQVVRLLGDPVLGAQLGGAGRRLMAERHSWTQVVDRLEAVYAEAIEAAGSAGAHRAHPARRAHVLPELATQPAPVPSGSSAPATGGTGEHDLEAVGDVVP